MAIARMTYGELFDILKAGVDEPNALFIDKFPIKALSLSRNTMSQAILDVRQRKVHVKKEPIEVVYNLKTGQFITRIHDYYALVDYVSKRQEFIPVKIWSAEYSDYHSNVHEDDLFFSPTPLNSFSKTFSIVKIKENWIAKEEFKLFLKEITKQVYEYNQETPPKQSEGMFPKGFNRHTLGSCLGATALATDYLLKRGITDFKIVEGWVYFPEYYDEDDEDNWSAHTWIEFKNGRKFDPTRKQWKEWGFDPDKGEVAYVTNKINRTYTPEEYQKVCLRKEDSHLKFIKEKLNEICEQSSVNETMTYKELLDLTTDDRKERAANVRVRSIPVSIEEGQEQWNFRYKSSPQTTVTDEPFEGHILFLKGEVEHGDDAMNLECKVDCGCPDFMYRFAYNDTQQGASDVGPDSLSGCINRRPKPAYDYGEGLCKHLTALSRYLRTKVAATKKSNLFEAISDVARQGPFDITYYD